jgi:hypothetical protein
VRDHGIGRALPADAPGDGAGVHARHADPAPARQPLVERLVGAEAGRPGDRLGHHAAQRMGVDGLDILGVCADIADVREGEIDDLTGIAGVGHHFLIARHRGVEAQLSDSLALGPGAAPPEQGAIGERHDPGRGVFVARNDSGRAGWLARGGVVGHGQILGNQVSG